MNNVIYTLTVERDRLIKLEATDRKRVKEYTESADHYAAQAAEYQAAIEAVKALKPEESKP